MVPRRSARQRWRAHVLTYALSALLIVITAVVVAAPGASALAPTRVAQIGAVANTTNALKPTLSIAVGAAGVPVGDVVVIAIAAQGPISVVHISDDSGNTYRIDSIRASSKVACTSALVSGEVTTALTAGQTISVTVSTGKAWGFVADDWRGIDGGADAFGAADSNGVASKTVSVSTSPGAGAGDVVVAAACISAKPGLIAGAGFTLDKDLKITFKTTNRELGSEFGTASSSGAQAATFTLATARNWAATVATYSTPIATPPGVAGFSPASGVPGSTVAVSGSGFASATDVTFGGVSVGSGGFTVADDASLSAVVPSGASSGDLCVVNVAGPGCASAPFTVTAPSSPVVSAVAPEHGSPGATVTISGSSFMGASDVTFNGSSAGPDGFTVDGDGSISAVVPEGATTGPICVATDAGTDCSAVDFTVDPPSSAPNIVFIVTDDMRADQLARMPVVNREIVDKGVMFDNAYVTQPLCCPSRVSILRGQYSHTTGIYSNSWQAVHAADLESSTLATWLDDVSYRTALIGKYFNGYNEFTFVPPGWDFWRGGEVGYFNYTLSEDGVAKTYGSAQGDYSTTVFTNYADQFIRSTDAATPLFLYVAYFAPHNPTTPEQAYASDPRCDGISLTGEPSFNESDVSDKPHVIQKLPSLTSTQGTNYGVNLPQRGCRTLLSVDAGVSRILTALSDTGRLGNTMLVFISDNGLLLGEHRVQGEKGFPYEEAIHVPVAIRYDPLTAGTAHHDTHFVQNIDLAPTAVDVAGASATPGCPSPPYKGVCSGAFDGRSLVPLLDGTASSWRDTILTEGQNRCTIRRSSWSYTYWGTKEEELYDLSTDPFQLTNLLVPPLSSDVQAIRDDLFRRLQEMCQPTPPSVSF
jgi:N-acetylglucosamine-6-sulfatase